MFILINTLFLAIIYIILIAFMLSRQNSEFGGDGDDNDNGRGGDGGWDDSGGHPPIDLPPGVFFLPPDADDPSKRHVRKEEEILV
jgi:hypothetical protein